MTRVALDLLGGDTAPGSVVEGALLVLDETARMQGDFLDLEPVLRDAVVLALPLTPLCQEDCSGLCVECGERLDDLPEDHAHGTPDPRWAALQGLTDDPNVLNTEEH